MANDLYALGPRAMQQLRDLIRSEGGRQSPIQNPLTRRHVVGGGDTLNSFTVPMLADHFIVYDGSTPSTSTYLSEAAGPHKPLGFIIPDIDGDIEILGGKVSVSNGADPLYGTATFTINEAGVYEFEYHGIFSIDYTATEFIQSNVRIGKDSSGSGFLFTIVRDETHFIGPEYFTAIVKHVNYFAANATFTLGCNIDSAVDASDRYCEIRQAYSAYSNPYLKVTYLAPYSDTAVADCNFTGAG